MLWCSLEIYCGKDQHADEVSGDVLTQSVDQNSEPAAVMRNLNTVLQPNKDGIFHTVVTARFYTSVQLALQLLHRNTFLI